MRVTLEFKDMEQALYFVREVQQYGTVFLDDGDTEFDVTVVDP